MNFKEYINFDYLFMTMCATIALRYFNSKKPKLVVQY